MISHIEDTLLLDVQGTCTGQYGFVIAVLEIVDVGVGTVLPGNGSAEFLTRYKAIVFKPFKGEVLDGIVVNVLKVCISWTVHIACSSCSQPRWASSQK